ncbi:protein kinase domain-containing protein [Actinomadura kijaniata]|uniref:serine/threonine-protein kinase n=1 Tax=Actinomadura kijaniata TaxID=46161 RepID=UPI000A8958CF|nr:serine/threonine-protein kinase [Actinomadura kijaniata]
MAKQPETIGPYEVLRLLGSGGMGSVHLALDGEGRTVAVKVLHPHIAAESRGLERMEREVAAMRQVRHPNVAEIVDADLTGETPYLVTRYVQGLSLHRVVEERGPLEGEALRAVARGLAEALRAVHAAGVVHRDLTPRNVMMTDGRPVLIDLGLAVAPEATRMTQGVIGTPGYIAPEVFDGQRPGPAADVFAWGATVAFAATGRHCFHGATTLEVFNRVLNGEPDLDGVPADLLGTVTAALAKNPAERPRADTLTGDAAPTPPPAPPLAPPPAAPPPRPAAPLEPLRARFRETMQRDDADGAVAAATELWRAAVATEDRAEIAEGLRALGEALVAKDDHHNAWANFEQGRALAAEVGRRPTEGWCLYGLGVCAAAYKDHARADHALRHAITIALETGDPTLESSCVFELAVMAESRRDFPQAEWMYDRLRRLSAVTGRTEDLAHALHGLGTCAVEQRRHERAEAFLTEALRVAEGLGDAELQHWIVDDLLRARPGRRHGG